MRRCAWPATVSALSASRLHLPVAFARQCSTLLLFTAPLSEPIGTRLPSLLKYTAQPRFTRRHQRCLAVIKLPAKEFQRIDHGCTLRQEGSAHHGDVAARQPR